MINNLYVWPTLHIWTKGEWKIEKLSDGSYHITIDINEGELENIRKNEQFYQSPDSN